MGEYARLYTLEHFGVDIGDDDDRPSKSKRHRCICGRTFKKPQSLADHQRSTGHGIAAHGVADMKGGQDV